MKQRMSGWRSWSGTTRLATIIAALALTRPCLAVVVTWQGPDGGTWETAANWAGLPVGQTEPGQNDDVVINANAKTIKVTGGPKTLLSLDIKPSTGALTVTKIVSETAASGQGTDIIFAVMGTVPGQTYGLRVGVGNKILAANGAAVGSAAPRGGGIGLFSFSKKEILIEKLTEIKAGQGGPSSPPPSTGREIVSPGAGGGILILALRDVRIGGWVSAGDGGDGVAAAPTDGGEGGHLFVTSLQGSIKIISEVDPQNFWPNVLAGRGGSARMKNRGGTGGLANLWAETDVVVDRVSVRGGSGGHSGTGVSIAGGLVIKAGRKVDNNGEIRGSGTSHLGASRGHGGNVTIERAQEVLNRGTIAGGIGVGINSDEKWPGDGGSVTITAKTKIKNDGPNGRIVGGDGGLQIHGGQKSGIGGGVTLTADNHEVGDAAAGDITNLSKVLGGRTGAAVAVPAQPRAGGSVTFTAARVVTLGEQSLVESGLGETPVTYKPRGDITISAQKVIGPEGMRIDHKLLKNAKRIVVKKKKVEVRTKDAESGGPAGTSMPEVVIDFSQLVTGAIEADELICFDAGADGIIDLTGICEGSDALIAPGEGKLPGDIHMLAREIWLDARDSCTGTRVTLDGITSPDAVFESKLCECCDIECPADLDHDGDVDGFDLAVLLGAWGACPTTPGQPCLADLNDDGIVASGDLAILLAAWGPCL